MSDLYAEDVNYWKSGASSPDTWLQKAKKELTRVGGKVLGEGFLNDASMGRAAYLISFELEGQRYDIKWPVLASKGGNEQAAQRQAATALYHDVKARCVAMKFHGARAAFLTYLVLPSGETAAEAANEELVKALPGMMRRLPPPRGGK